MEKFIYKNLRKIYELKYAIYTKVSMFTYIGTHIHIYNLKLVNALQAY